MGRTLVLEVWTGPDAGLAFALPAGGRAVVGRTPPSDVVVPSDRTVSRRHFALSFDGRDARMEDLGSSHGTTVNGRYADDATILNGDLIAAGGTTFRVRLTTAVPPHARPVGSPGVPPPTPAPIAAVATAETFETVGFRTPAPTATIHDRVLAVLRSEPSPLFAILDAARDPKVFLRIHECPERKQSLYENAAPDLAFVAPYLIELPKSSPFLDLIVREGWGGSWGVFLTSDRPFEEVRKHLRRLLTVQTEAGKPFLFRFYDPRVLRAWLPSCDAEETGRLLGPIDAFLVEGEPSELPTRWPPLAASGSRGRPGGRAAVGGRGLADRLVVRDVRLATLAVDRRRIAAAETLGRGGFRTVEDPADGSLTFDDAEGRRGRLSFGEDGSTRVEMGGGHVVTDWRDPFGRLERLESPGGTPVEVRDGGTPGSLEIRRGRYGNFSIGRDASGRPTEIAFPDRTVTRFEDRPEGRRVIHRDGATTEFRRDAEGRTAAVVNPRGHATRIEYDSTSRRFLHPDGSVHEYGLDEDGALESWSVNGRRHASFLLAADAPRLDVEYADGHRVSLTFAGDLLTEASGPQGTLKLEYDEAGRLVREDWNGRTVEYLRDAAGLLAGIVTPDGETLGFPRDARGRVARVVDWSGAETALGYAPHGPMDRVDFPNGVRTRSVFDEVGRCASTRTSSPASAVPLVEFGYGYDACDRVASVEGAKASRRFEYDAEGRLVRARSGDSDVRFQLDPMGNAVRVGSSSRRYDPLDRLVEIDGAKVVHDDLGRVVSGPTPRGPARFAHDGQGRLVEVVLADGTAARYEYDPIGRRTRKTVGGTVTEYAWAGALLLSEKTVGPAGESRRDHLFLPGTFQPLATRVDGRIFRHHLDGSGLPSSMTDETGREVWSAVLEPFGEARIRLEEVENPWRLPGQSFDPETGLHYNLARFYHPGWGRYLAPDPLRADGGSLNFYVYAQADPINKADPTGEIVPLLIAAGIGLAIGAAIGAGVEYYRQRQAVDEGRQSEVDAGAVAKQALLGGLIGAVGGGVGALAGAAALGVGGAATMGAVVTAGAVEGAAASVAETCAQAALEGEGPPTAGDLLGAALLGGAIGAVTAGVGGLVAGKMARAAERKAAQTAAREAEEKAAREAAEGAGKTKPHLRSPDDPISVRQRENQALRENGTMEKDLAERGISRERVRWMQNKECPLSFENPEQYQQFQSELKQALKESGLEETTAGMKGTSTTFYSENPKKPLGHHFDADPSAPADVDVDVSGPGLTNKMEEAGKSPNPKMPHVYKTKDTEEVFPKLREFSEKWSEKLGRDVNFVGLSDPGPRATDPSDFILN